MPCATAMLGEAKVGVFKRKVPAPVLVSAKPPRESPVLMVAVEPLATAKLLLPDKLRLPTPLNVQLPLVVAEPKVNPEMFCAEPTVIVLVTAVVSPKKTAASPETHGKRVVPLLLQKLFVPQVPLPAWKPAVDEVSHVTVAPIAGVRAKAAARRKDVRTRDFVVVLRIRELGCYASTNASTRKRVNP